MKPHPIAVDNYFVNREDTPRDENGNYNYECLEAIDVELFNRDMNALLKGERVELPRFNFKLGKREYKGDFLQMQPNDILVIEGIHGLNDRLSRKMKIVLSGMKQREADFVNEMFISSTHDHILFISNYGMMYRLKCYEIPEGSKASRGFNIVNLLPLKEGEKIAAMLRTKDFDEGKYLVTVTRGEVFPVL